MFGKPSWAFDNSTFYGKSNLYSPAFGNGEPVDSTRDLFGRQIEMRQEPPRLFGNTRQLFGRQEDVTAQPATEQPHHGGLFSAPDPFEKYPFKYMAIKKEDDTIVCDCNPYYETGLFGDKTKHDAYEQGYIDGYRRGFNAARDQR